MPIPVGKTTSWMIGTKWAEDDQEDLWAVEDDDDDDDDLAGDDGITNYPNV